MKRLIYIFLLICLSTELFGQTTIGSTSFNTVSELRGVTALNNVQVIVSGNATATDGNGGIYMYSTSSTATDDGFTVIKPNSILTGNPGRWTYVQNQNTIKGTATVSGTALQTSYVINYGQTLPAVPTQIHVQPITDDAATSPIWVDPALITTTNFTIKYRAVPIIGTNNIKIWWLVIKR